MNRYSSLLKNLIEKSGMSLTDISLKCEEGGVKVTVSYLSKLKSGKMPPPSFKVSSVIAKALNVPPEELIAATLYENEKMSKRELQEVLKEVYPDYRLHEFVYKISEIFNYKDFPPYVSASEEVIWVPVINNITAQKKIFLEDNIEEWVSLPILEEFQEAEVFIFTVPDDSMMGSRIHKGDKVIVKLQSEIEDGEIMLVNANGSDATLKRVKKIDKQIILFPDNPNYEPLILNNKQTRIIGKVIKVIFEPKKYTGCDQ